MLGEVIVNIEGTLGEEWHDKQQHCDIHIYSNRIKIDTLISGNTDKKIEYGFENINQLKINSIVEEKKKFLFSSKIYKLRLLIEYDKTNEGIISIKPIIVNNGDYEKILKGIEDYNRRIEEAEKQREKERNDRIKAESFKAEFISIFEELSLLYKSIKVDSDVMQSNLKVKPNTDNLFHFIVKEMYEKIGDTKSIDYAYKVLYDPHYVKSLMDRTIHFYLCDCNGVPIPINKVIESINAKLHLWMNNIPDDYLYQKLILNDDEIKSTFDMLLESFSEDDYNWIALDYFPAIFMLSFSFIKALILHRNISKFSENVDLLTMYKNLTDSTNIDIGDISEKLYPIYKKYYINTFDRIYNELEFRSFMNIFNLYYSNAKYPDAEVYEKEILQFIDNLTEDGMSFKENRNSILLIKVQELYSNIDNNKYFKSKGYPYDLNYKYIDGVYIMLYEYILKRIGSFLPSDVFFILFNEYKTKITSSLKEKQQDDITQKERERLLLGDLSKEIEEESDRYSFKNISTGYEFEEYLKVIFERMGYEVEVTKKSNDQGGDLVIEKDGIRTVVQAKFYSNPVGNKAVQEVFSAISYYKANKGMIVTNSSYTNSAVALAEVNDITLVDGEELGRIRNAILGSM